MNTIKEFFNGNIYPFEMMTCTKESVAAEKVLNKYLEIVDENCPQNDETVLSEKIRFQISEIQNLTAEQAFELGFTLGLRFTAECYSAL